MGARCLVSIFVCNVVDRVRDPIDFPTVAAVHDDCLMIGSNVSQFTVLFAFLSITGLVSVCGRANELRFSFTLINLIAIHFRGNRI